MKTVLTNDEETGEARPSFAEQIGAAAAALKSYLVHGARPRQSEAWLSGYNAFYDGVKANPHAPESPAWKEWELGSQAFEQDFEW